MHTTYGTYFSFHIVTLDINYVHFEQTYNTTSMISIWWNNINKITNVTMKSKVDVTKLAQGKQNVTQLTVLLNHNKKLKFLYKCTSNHVSTEKNNI